MQDNAVSAQALEAARRAFEIETQAIAACMARMDWTAFGRAVAMLADAPRIAASGCGHSGIACRHFAHLMCCIQRPARFLSPAEAVHGAMGFLQAGDVLLLASRGGKTEELLPMLRVAQAQGAGLIAVTEDGGSPLARGAHVWLPMYVTRECDKFNSQGTASNAVLNAIFDALQTALIEQTGYQQSQFALIHPGGAVGKRLNPS